MIALLRKYAANGFADFPGLRVSGTVPIKQALINEVLAEFLRTRTAPRAAEAPEETGAVIDSNVLLDLVKKAEVRAEAGVLTVEFELRV